MKRYVIADKTLQQHRYRLFTAFAMIFMHPAYRIPRKAQDWLNPEKFKRLSVNFLQLSISTAPVIPTKFRMDLTGPIFNSVTVKIREIVPENIND